MMRTLTLVLLSLLLVTAAFALESGPSNKVGYVKIYCIGFEDSPGVPAEAYTPFGLPFIFWDVPGSNVPTYGSESRCPSDIIGSQAGAGYSFTADLVLRQGGDYAYRDTTLGNAWTGYLEDNCSMDPAGAYYFDNHSGFDKTLVLAGDAEFTATGIPETFILAKLGPNIEDQTFTPYSWRDPREMPMSQLGLITAGFQGGASQNESDQIWMQGGDLAWYNTTTSTWEGFLTSVTPGSAYWISSMHEDLVNFGYFYTYDGTGSALRHAPSSRAAVISKVRPKVAPHAPVKAHAASN